MSDEREQKLSHKTSSDEVEPDEVEAHSKAQFAAQDAPDEARVAASDEGESDDDVTAHQKYHNA